MKTHTLLIVETGAAPFRTLALLIKAEHKTPGMNNPQSQTTYTDFAQCCIASRLTVSQQ